MEALPGQHLEGCIRVAWPWIVDAKIDVEYEKHKMNPQRLICSTIKTQSLASPYLAKWGKYFNSQWNYLLDSLDYQPLHAHTNNQQALKLRHFSSRPYKELLYSMIPISICIQRPLSLETCYEIQYHNWTCKFVGKSTLSFHPIGWSIYVGTNPTTV